MRKVEIESYWYTERREVKFIFRCLRKAEEYEVCSENECPFGSGDYNLLPELTDDESIIYDYIPGIFFRISF